MHSTPSASLPTDDRAAYPYAEYSELAGPFKQPSDRVSFVSVLRGSRRTQGIVLVAAALVVETVFLVWLLLPQHRPDYDGSWAFWLSMSMIAAIGLIEGLRLVNVGTLAYSTLSAQDPVPMVPEAGSRLAFITTIVPSNEPIKMARKTLEAALRVRHDGPFDVWLLDEGDDPDVRAMCRELGVQHFSRKGVQRYNQTSGSFKAKTKHGNYNAWLDAYGDGYDFWVSVDTDHVPHPNFAERMMGYFRDPDVAFVVGPQVYGNYDNFVTRAAESQQFLFHGVLQRAGNKQGCAMFVGTNNAVRISALKRIGGLADSITEDAATSIVWLSSVNPATGNTYRSVYTPDVLAVGEGPTSWTDYFIQQGRWSRGTDEVILRRAGTLRRLSAMRRLHYTLLMSYYPSAALSWVLGTFNIMAYLVTGVGGVRVAAQLWLTLYLNAAVLQVGIYLWNRRHNVSPHEPAGSSGITGMFVSVLAAPMYVDALVQAVRNRNISFKVTPKGDDGSQDRLATFSRSLGWAAVLTTGLLVSLPLGHDNPTMRGWALLALLVTLLPVAIWQGSELYSRLLSAAVTRRLAGAPGSEQPGLAGDSAVPVRAALSSSLSAVEAPGLPGDGVLVIDLRASPAPVLQESNR